MVNKTLLVGAIVGLAGTVAIALLLSEAATAQTMQHMNSGIGHNMFSASGMSMVQDVQISGISITDDNQMTVNLIYTGNASSPSVAVIAMTDTMMGENMDGMTGPGAMGMHSGNSGMMAGQSMMGSNMPMSWNHQDMPAWNATQWRGWHDQMSAQMGGSAKSIYHESLTGSTIANSGWESGGSITIRLDGESAYEASELHVMVFPHLT